MLPLLAGSASHAQDLTAGVVMDKMNADQRIGYISGIVEGLAYMRFAKDGDEEPGMKCIYQWFYEKDGTLRMIHQAFEYFKDDMPGAVIAAMVEKECGK